MPFVLLSPIFMLNETDVNVFSAINQKFLLLDFDYCDFKDKFNCVEKK